MIDKIKFKEKYNTDRSQRREESYLEEVSEEDREIYSDVEILTGIDSKGNFNKFFQVGYNKGKKYNTVRSKFIAAFKRYVDKKIFEEKTDEIFDRLWKSSKNGSFNHLKLLLDRGMGNEPENLNVTVDDISFKIDDSKIIGKKKKE